MRLVMRVLCALLLILALWALPPGLPARGASEAAHSWLWPTEERRVLRPFEPPLHDYAPGHRGIDVAGSGEVRAPAAGVIAFSGPVAGRGILTIDHGRGLVTSFEPVTSELTAGTAVSAGEVVATLEAGGHVGAHTLHFGVRAHGRYVNPLLLLGGIPRAVLLPCC